MKFAEMSRYQNVAQYWYRSILDTVVGYNNYSIWETHRALPYSSVDINATLNYFDHVIWYSAYTGTETYFDASASFLNYINNQLRGVFYLKYHKLFELLHQNLVAIYC